MLRIRSSMAARVQRSRHSRMGRTGDGWPRRTGPHGANMVSRHSPAAAPAMENARATPSPRFSPSSSTPARAALAQDDDTRAALERMATEGDLDRALMSAEERRKPWHINLGREGQLVGRRPDSWWTGPHPATMTEAQGKFADGSVRSLPQPDLSAVTRESAQNYLDNTWALTEVLLGGLQGEEAFFGPCYHELRHPLIFYLGHVAALYINKAVVAGLLPAPLNKELEDKFEVGVDEMSWDDLGKNDELWPTVRETQEYRRQAYAMVTDLINRELDDTPRAIGWDDPMWALFMGCEHERIHLETSSVLMRELPVRLMRRPDFWPANHASERAQSAHPPVAGVDYPTPRSVQLEAQTVSLGKPRDFPTYGWDNVYGDRHQDVAEIEVDAHLVSNGEYWQFVQDGGYRTREYWCQMGWEWRSFRNLKSPAFWAADGPEGSHRFKLRTIWEEVPMQWAWPVDCTHYEANAFAAWKRDKTGKHARLPTEAEVNAMRDAPVTDGSAMARDHILDARLGDKFNLNLVHGSQSDVDAKPSSQQGLYDVFGNVWQHALDEMKPLDESFQLHPYYDDFTAPCFDGKHHLILGGSFISTGEEASVFARYHFRGHFQQHAGFRTVVNAADKHGDATVHRVGDGMAPAAAEEGSSASDAAGFEREGMYEDQSVVDSYMLLHYGTAQDTFAPHGAPPGGTFEDALHFPQRCADWLAAGAAGGAALDVGCAVGGASAALTAHYDDVVGVDLSRAFVRAAQGVARDAAHGESTAFKSKTEGSATLDCAAELPPNCDLSRASYYEGDACDLLRAVDSARTPEEAEALALKLAGGFDAVLMANLLCRLPDPEKCLMQMSNIVKPGGRLLLTTPFTWLDSFTPREKWLGGRDATDSFEGLRGVLEREGFELTERKPMPLVIRETARKFQYIVADGTMWTRRND